MPSQFSEYVHQLGKASRWVIAEVRRDGSYMAPLRNQPGGLHCYQSYSLLAIAQQPGAHVYLTRGGALRAARRIYGGDL